MIRAPWLLEWQEELGKLEQLRALLANVPPSPECEIAQEHVESARSCVWGAMTAECELDLELARSAIRGIPDRTTRQSAQQILASLPSNRRS